MPQKTALTYQDTYRGPLRLLSVTWQQEMGNGSGLCSMAWSIWPHSPWGLNWVGLSGVWRTGQCLDAEVGAVKCQRNIQHHHWLLPLLVSGCFPFWDHKGLYDIKSIHQLLRYFSMTRVMGGSTYTAIPKGMAKNLKIWLYGERCTCYQGCFYALIEARIKVLISSLNCIYTSHKP